MESYQQEFDAVVNGPATPYWLRAALLTLDKADPVDAVNEAEWLADLMRRRVDEIKLIERAR